jgi:hypothetical protein
MVEISLVYALILRRVVEMMPDRGAGDERVLPKCNGRRTVWWMILSDGLRFWLMFGSNGSKLD